MIVELYLPPQRICTVFEQIANINDRDEWAAKAHVPEFSSLKTWRDRLWSEIQLAINDVAENGASRVKHWIKQVQLTIGQMRQELTERAEDVLASVEELLKEACRRIQTALLALLPGTVSIGKEDALLKEVTMQVQLAVDSGLTASLNWALKMTAGGTMSVSAKYAV
jgi:hypothetical protein